jgi:hypothetical protein
VAARADPTTLDWYMEAGTYHNETVAMPPRRMNLSCTSPAVCTEYSAASGEWVVSFSKALMHADMVPEPSGMWEEEKRQQVGGGKLFGVVAVFVRLERLAASFMAATTLKAAGGLGCGDVTSLASDTVCYLIDHRARVLLHPALLAASANGQPHSPIMEALLTSDDMLQDLSFHEPIIVQRLLAAGLLAYRTDAFRNSDFRHVEIDQVRGRERKAREGESRARERGQRSKAGMLGGHRQQYESE